MNQIVEILKGKTYQIPGLLFMNYKKLELSDQDLILIIYLYNLKDTSYNPKQISNDLDIPITEVLEHISNLQERGILSLEIASINNVRNEFISLDLLYEKLAFLLSKKETKKESDIFSIFEDELGRQLSPTEIGILRGWLDDGYTENLIKLALKEAVYNGVSNFRYIERIVFEWHKKGVETEQDVEKLRKEFKKSKPKKELFDYDWLNDSQDS